MLPLPRRPRRHPAVRVGPRRHRRPGRHRRAAGRGRARPARPGARRLEARWETRLTDLAAAQAALATQLSAQPDLPAPEQLAATVADLPALWSEPTTSDKDRKRLLRPLLGDVTLTPSASD